MNTTVLNLTEFISKGLAPNNNPRNRPYLVTSTGAFVEDGLLQAIEQFTAIDVTGIAAMAFPWPQLFVLDEIVLLCSQTAIYEYAGGSLSAKISGLTAGSTWEVVDFKSWVWMTNGKVSVTRNPKTGIFAIDATLPTGVALCNYNGQLLVGGPNAPATAATFGLTP